MAHHHPHLRPVLLLLSVSLLLLIPSPVLALGLTYEPCTARTPCIPPRLCFSLHTAHPCPTTNSTSSPCVCLPPAFTPCNSPHDCRALGEQCLGDLLTPFVCASPLALALAAPRFAAAYVAVDDTTALDARREQLRVELQLESTERAACGDADSVTHDGLSAEGDEAVTSLGSDVVKKTRARDVPVSSVLTSVSAADSVTAAAAERARSISGDSQSNPYADPDDIHSHNSVHNSNTNSNALPLSLCGPFFQPTSTSTSGGSQTTACPPPSQCVSAVSLLSGVPGSRHPHPCCPSFPSSFSSPHSSFTNTTAPCVCYDPFVSPSPVFCSASLPCATAMKCIQPPLSPPLCVPAAVADAMLLHQLLLRTDVTRNGDGDVDVMGVVVVDSSEDGMQSAMMTSTSLAPSMQLQMQTPVAVPMQVVATSTPVFVLPSVTSLLTATATPSTSTAAAADTSPSASASASPTSSVSFVDSDATDDLAVTPMPDDLFHPQQQQEQGSSSTSDSDSDFDDCDDVNADSTIPPTPLPPLEDGTQLALHLCISASALHHAFSQGDLNAHPSALLWATHKRSTVLCDMHDSCASPGHVVRWRGVYMTMAEYCNRDKEEEEGRRRCRRRVMLVNNPRYDQVGIRIRARTEGLWYTALAAPYGWPGERWVVRMMAVLGA